MDVPTWTNNNKKLVCFTTMNQTLQIIIVPCRLFRFYGNIPGREKDNLTCCLKKRLIISG